MSLLVKLDQAAKTTDERDEREREFDVVTESKSARLVDDLRRKIKEASGA
jgi:hypothetical protein